jgi:hypothetical protein
MILEFQPSEKESTHKIIEAVEHLNEDVKRKRGHFKDAKHIMDKKDYKFYVGYGMNKNKIIMLLNLIDQHGNLENVRKLRLFSDKTISRYKNDLEKLGIVRNTVSTYRSVYAALDFQEYYQLLLVYPDKVYNNRYINDMF